MCTNGTPIDSNGGAAGNAVDATNGIVPDSADVTLNSAGVYEFWAVYLVTRTTPGPRASAAPRPW